EPEVLVDRLDQRQLIVGIVDVELRRKTWADVSQGLAVAPEKADAEGMEGRHPRTRFRGRVVSEVLQNAVPHLPCGFVRKRDRENRRTGDAVGADEMRDAVRDDTRFAGAGAG